MSTKIEILPINRKFITRTDYLLPDNIIRMVLAGKSIVTGTYSDTDGDSKGFK